MKTVTATAKKKLARASQASGSYVHLLAEKPDNKEAQTKGLHV